MLEVIAGLYLFVAFSILVVAASEPRILCEWIAFVSVAVLWPIVLVFWVWWIVSLCFVTTDGIDDRTPW